MGDLQHSGGDVAVRPRGADDHAVKAHRKPSTYVSPPPISASEPAPGFYKRRLRRGVWQPCRIVEEGSRDEEGRIADRPRLVLYIGQERYQQGYGRQEIVRRFWPLNPITEDEFRRMNAAITETGGETNLASLPPRF